MITVCGYELKKINFPDGTQKIDIEVIKMNPLNSIIIKWIYEDDSELFSLICISKHLRDHYPAYRQELVMPYIPNARMDRVKKDTEVFTLKYFCDIINSLNFNNVIVLDAHSDVSLALLNNVRSMSAYDYMANTVNDIHQNHSDIDLVTFVPDAGAAKRYGNMLNNLSDYPCGFAIKNRDWETGKILGLSLETNGIDLTGKDVLIVDDICSKGGTFYYTAKALKEAGANRIFLHATHCENSIFEGKLLEEEGLIEHIYTTESLVRDEHPLITTWYND